MHPLTAGVSQPYFFPLTEGRMAFEDSLKGSPTVICVPGMGDTRGQFRALAPKLIEQGLRVIALDPRGQGESDGGFSEYSASCVGDDLLQLLEAIDEPVYFVGNSSGGAASAWAAAHRPDAVRGLIFLDAFLRDHPMGASTKFGLHMALSGPWAQMSWINYYKRLFRDHQPSDQKDYTKALAESLKRKGHLEALRAMTFASKANVTACLRDVRAPILAIAGSKDPDFKRPEVELDWILSRLNGEKALIDRAGHYPHLEFPDQVVALMKNFIAMH